MVDMHRFERPPTRCRHDPATGHATPRPDVLNHHATAESDFRILKAGSDPPGIRLLIRRRPCLLQAPER